MNALAEQRYSVRCAQCRLVQFMTASGKCRRCQTGLIPEEPEPAPAPLVVVQPIARSGEKVSIIIRDIRLMRHFSQAQLATRMGVARSYVSKVENDYATPTVSSLDRFAKALQVDISTLLGIPRPVLTADPFIAEIAMLIAHLDSEHRAIFLNTVRQLAAAK